MPGGAARRPADQSVETAAGPDEGVLVVRAAGGDTAAFTLLVERYQDRVYRLALGMVGPDTAEDIAQQAFLNAWQGLARFAGAAAFGTWLHRIAINCCLDHLRRSGRHRPTPLEEVAYQIAAGDDVEQSVVDAAESSERQAALAWALAELPSEQRLLLHLRIAEERSYDEIAALLSLKSRTVGTRLYRARARLHTLLVRRLGERPGDFDGG